MRDGMWDAKNDQIDKQTSLTIPLENQSGEILGFFQIGCDQKPVRGIFLRVGLSKKLGYFGKQGNQEVALFNDGYRIGTNSYANVSETMEYNFVRFHGFRSAVSLTDPETYGIEEAHKIAEMIRRIHRSKLKFKLSSEFGKQTSSSLVVEVPPSISDAHFKLFETVAAYCIDLTN